MIRRLVSVGAGVAVAVAAGGVALAASDQPTVTTAQTRHFVVHFSPFFYSDIDGNGRPSKGDTIVFNDQLLQGGKHVGQDAGTCTIANNTTLVTPCTGTIELPAGQVTFAWLNTPPPVKHIAITGGTGRFANVRGEGTVTEHRDGTGTMTLRLIP